MATDVADVRSVLDAAEAAVVMIIAVGLSTLGYRLLFGASEKEYVAPRPHAEPSQDT